MLAQNLAASWRVQPKRSASPFQHALDQDRQAGDLDPALQGFAPVILGDIKFAQFVGALVARAEPPVAMSPSAAIGAAAGRLPSSSNRSPCRAAALVLDFAPGLKRLLRRRSEPYIRRTGREGASPGLGAHQGGPVRQLISAAVADAWQAAAMGDLGGERRRKVR